MILPFTQSNSPWSTWTKWLLKSLTIIEDDVYGQVDFERFEAAFGTDLQSVLPQSQLDQLTDDNTSEIMKQNGVETGFDITTMMR